MQTFHEIVYIYNFKPTFHLVLAEFPAVALAIYLSVSNLHEEIFFPPNLAPRRHLVLLCVAVRLATYGMTEK